MIKKFIAPVVVSGALLGSIVVGGTAFAATPTQATVTAPAVHAKANATRVWVKSHRRSIRRAAIAVSATTIGVTPRALVTELRTGKSIAQVAGEHNVSASTVEAAMLTAAEGKVSQAVTAGKLTQAQAAKIDAALPARIAKLVNHVF